MSFSVCVCLLLVAAARMGWRKQGSQGRGLESSIQAQMYLAIVLKTRPGLALGLRPEVNQQSVHNKNKKKKNASNYQVLRPLVADNSNPKILLLWDRHRVIEERKKEGRRDEDTSRDVSFNKSLEANLGGGKSCRRQ